MDRNLHQLGIQNTQQPFILHARPVIETASHNFQSRYRDNIALKNTYKLKAIEIKEN